MTDLAPDPAALVPPGEPLPDAPPAPLPDAPFAAPPAAPPGRPPALAEPAPRQNRSAALGLVALLVVLAFGVGIAVGRATVAPSGPAQPASASLAAGSLAPSPGGSSSPGSSSPAGSSIAGLPSAGTRLGRADAKVVIEYWADYQCPFCARFALDLIPQLASRIADGTVAIVHRDDAFLGQESVDAAIAVRCAGRQGRFWEMHDAVYAAQQGENQGAFARTRLKQVAASVGLEPAAFATCLDDRAALVDVLDDTSLAVRSGVKSTPTIDVNGTRFLGVPDVTRLLATIDAAAAGAAPAVLPSPSPSRDAWSDTATSGRSAGPGTAPVSVELWMDYQAPASAAVAKDLEPQLRTRIASGAIRVTLHDLATLGDESVLAASTVRCVARQDGRTWFVSDVLAASAQGPGTGLFTPASILMFGARVGLDVRALSACLDDASIADGVKAETATGIASGLPAGPAVVVLQGTTVVSRFTGALDIAKILAAIDAAGAAG